MDNREPVLVLGATSLVGRFLLPRLAAERVPTTAVSRTPRESAGAVRWIAAYLADPGTLSGGGPEARVFSLSPIWLLPPVLPVLHERGMRRLVAFSSTSRFTKGDSTSVKERQVARALEEGEAAVGAFCKANGVGFTILRPTLVYAEGADGNVSRLAGLIRRFGVLPLPGEGVGLRQPVHADDLALLARLCMDASPTNAAYDAPGGETLSYRAMVERIFEGLGRSPRIAPVPGTLLRAGYVLAKPFLPGSTVGMIDRINQDLVFDPGPVSQAFGWAPREFRPRFGESVFR